MGLANTPVPPPFIVLLPPTTGFDTVPQQTPRAVTADPPAEVILPPLNAVLAVIEVIAAVVMVGKSDTGSGAFISQLKEIKASRSIKYKFFI